MSKTQENEERQASCCRAKNDTKLQPTNDDSSQSAIASVTTGVDSSQSIGISTEPGHLQNNSTVDEESKPDLLITSDQSNNTINGTTEVGADSKLKSTNETQNHIADTLAEEEGSTSSTSRCQCGTMAAKDKSLPEWKGIWIDGKPFACVACHRGHRRGNCRHVNRLLVPSQAAGRPKGTGANSRKKIKVSGRVERCDCPAKTCDCEGQCNCRPMCYCTRRSFAIVYIAGPSEGKPSFQPDMYRKGRFMIKHETWADLEGEEITDEERNRRETIKAQLIARESQSGLLAPATPSLSMHNTSSTAFSSQIQTPQSTSYATPSPSVLVPGPEPAFDFNSPFTDWESFKNNSIATHSWNINRAVQEPATFDAGFANPHELKVQSPSLSSGPSLNLQTPFDFTTGTQDSQNLFNGFPSAVMQAQAPAGCCTHRNTVVENPTQLTQQGCNCGDMCKCLGCPQHPRNDETRLHIQRISDSMASQNLPVGNFQYGSTAGFMSQSCMGNSFLAYGQHDSLDAATFAAAQHAPPSTNMMLVYQADEHNQYSDAMVHTRFGTDWIMQQPPPQPFQQQVQPLPHSLQQSVQHIEDRQVQVTNPVLAAPEIDQINFEQPSRPVPQLTPLPQHHFVEQGIRSPEPVLAPADSGFFDFDQASQTQPTPLVEEQEVSFINHNNMLADNNFFDRGVDQWLQPSMFPGDAGTHLATTYS